MEEVLLFSRSGQSWSKEEDEKLNKLYNVDLLDIIQISKIHERMPGGILSRLRKNGIIIDTRLARGYQDFINNPIYKKEKIDKKKSITINSNIINVDKEQNEIKQNITYNDFLNLHQTIHSMKNEIQELKNIVNDLSVMLKAVYEFEEQ